MQSDTQAAFTMVLGYIITSFYIPAARLSR